MEKQDVITIDDAKDYLKERIWDGTHCLVCNQFVKLYKRKIYSRIARLLIKLYWLDRDIKGSYRFVHIDKICQGITEKGSGDFAKLQFWDLITLEENKDPKKQTSGMWAITERGKAFVTDDLKVRKYVLLIIGEFIKFSGPKVSIIDALGEDFKYNELMAGI